MKKAKIVKALPVAIYSIQFLYDETDTPRCVETANDGRLPDFMSMNLFGHQVAESKLLDEIDKERLASFCRAYLAKLERLKESHA